MIRIDKQGKRPSIVYLNMLKKGLDKLQEATQIMIDSYMADPISYQNGTEKFDFNSDFYAHDEIKKRLIDLQHGKCCFCESKITHIAYGDVEHFRPKKGYRQNRGDTLEYPAYFWLAYDWDNLFFSCELCNQRHKENLFPLINPASRATNPNQDWRNEEPLFIHPDFDDPEDHITFQEAFIKAMSIRGQETILNLGLNRDELLEYRNEAFDEVQSLIKVYQMVPELEPHKTDAKNFLLKRLPLYMADSHQYSAMFRANFGEFLRELEANMI